MKPPLVLLAAAALLAPGCSRRPEPAAVDDRAAPPHAATDAAVESASGGASPTLGSPDEVVVDPFCGLRLRRSEAAASATWRGTTYWFCLADHRDAFLADPQRALRRLGIVDAE